MSDDVYKDLGHRLALTWASLCDAPEAAPPLAPFARLTVALNKVNAGAAAKGVRVGVPVPEEGAATFHHCLLQMTTLLAGPDAADQVRRPEGGGGHLSNVLLALPIMAIRWAISPRWSHARPCGRDFRGNVV